MYTHMCIYIYIYAHRQTYIHTCMHVYTYILTCSNYLVLYIYYVIPLLFVKVPSLQSGIYRSGLAVNRFR